MTQNEFTVKRDLLTALLADAVKANTCSHQHRVDGTMLRLACADKHPSANITTLREMLQ